MAVIKSRKIGEDEIVERKVVAAECRFGRTCIKLPVEGMKTKSESTGKKERDAKTLKDVGSK